MTGLIDCDNFFCSCERVFRPDLAHTPIVVLSNNDGCVVARSAEVKAMGIREGMPYHELQRDYPDAGIVAFSSNYSLYADMSRRVISILREEVPEVMQYSIDEAFIELDGIRESDLKAWGEALTRRVRQCTGMPVSLGIAPTKTLAKIASRYAKKFDGYRKCCLVSTEEQRTKALRLCPIRSVWGIGRHIARSLESIGVRTALDYALLPQSLVRHRFHVTGERTWSELNGNPVIDICGLDGRTKKSILTSRSFPGMITELCDLRSHVANYAARCAAKLRDQGSVCSILSVFLRSNHFREDLEQYDSEASIIFANPTSTTPELVQGAMQVLDGLYRKGIYYKRAGVMVSGLIPGYASQPDLFTYDPESAEKLRGVSEAMDHINSLMGADTIVLGAQQYRKTDSSGKSVKFVNAIRRALKSPDYSTSLDSFRIC